MVVVVHRFEWTTLCIRKQTLLSLDEIIFNELDLLSAPKTEVVIKF
jgi:hypothetical protein